MTTTLRTRARVRFNKRRLALILMFTAFAVIVAASIVGLFSSDDEPPIKLNAGIDQVTCDNAQEVSDRLSVAADDFRKVPASYDKLKELGFSTPVSPADLARLKDLVEQRQAQIGAIVTSVDNGTCAMSQQTATIKVDGEEITLPLVLGGDPKNPSLGSDANTDPNTLPVNLGSPGEVTQENSWSNLDETYRDTSWYKDCARKHLGIDWDQDVSRFKQVEVEKTRVILAINTSPSLTDDQIRQRLAPENPDVDLSKLQVQRVPAIVNTRHLEENRCDVFIQQRSELRILTGVPQFDSKDVFTETDFDKGILNECDNFAMKVEQPVKPNKPTPGTSTAPPTTTNPPVTTTVPPKTCPPGQVWNGNKCVESKIAAQGAGAKDKVPTQVRGTAPPATKESRPPNPPDTYVPPSTTHPPATTTRTSVPAPPPSSEVEEPFDPCEEDPSHPACG